GAPNLFNDADGTGSSRHANIQSIAGYALPQTVNHQRAGYAADIQRQRTARSHRSRVRFEHWKRRPEQIRASSEHLWPKPAISVAQIIVLEITSTPKRTEY